MVGYQKDLNKFMRKNTRLDEKNILLCFVLSIKKKTLLISMQTVNDIYFIIAFDSS